MILLRDQWKTWQKTTIYNFTPLANRNRQFSAFYLVLISIVGCIVALVRLFLNKNKKSFRKYPVFNSTFTLLVKALIVVTWPSFYQQKSTLTRTKLKHFHFRTCINNWLQYASTIVMFYSLICITYLTPPFLLHAILETALTHLRYSRLLSGRRRGSEWLLFNANSAFFQLYHGENKLIINEMMTTRDYDKREILVVICDTDITSLPSNHFTSFEGMTSIQPLENISQCSCETIKSTKSK